MRMSYSPSPHRARHRKSNRKAVAHIPCTAAFKSSNIRLYQVMIFITFVSIFFLSFLIPLQSTSGNSISFILLFFLLFFALCKFCGAQEFFLDSRKQTNNETQNENEFKEYQIKRCRIKINIFFFPFLCWKNEK